MGEVYRATDTKLGREVALKLLPEAFAADPERLARFEREAKLLASLNHPGIAHLYGFETAALGQGASAHVLVMELAEGEDLAERLKRGPVPPDDALSIAKQVAEALEEAHGKGVVHRDLKPGNVKVTSDGKVKVLDFGLAKAWTGDGVGTTSSADLSQSPTLAHTGTAAGLILGTAAYMSPEQARGKAVDKRADIWAFGVVLFEMLAGKRLFAGETVSDVLASVLKTEPDWSALPAAVPAPVRRLLRRCLERDPRRRLHDIADARIALEDALAGVAEDAGAPAEPARRQRSPRAPLAWLALATAASAGAFAVGRLTAGREETTAPVQLAIQLPESQEVVTEGNALLAFSPDGESLVFSGREGGRLVLMRRRLGGRDAEPIPGTDGGESAFFSPDGRWIGFVADGRMRKVPVEGGRPFPLAEAQGAGGAAWLPDDTIVYAPIYSEGLYRIPADGGTAERLTTPDRAGGELGHWWPALLPGARRLLFTAFRTPVDRSRIGVVDLATREVRYVVEGGFFARYVPSGHLLYAKGQRLYAAPFDPGSATVTGPATAVLDDLHPVQIGGLAQFAVSSRGTLAYVTESLGSPLRELVFLDRAGRATPAVGERRRFLSASLSPDGAQAALTIQGESQDLWTLSLARGTLSRVTDGEATEYGPEWTRDGRELLYVLDRPPFELHRVALGMEDAGRPLWDEPAELDTNGIAVSPDARTIAFVRTELKTGANVYARPVDGSAPPRAIRAARGEERAPSFSPDGRFVAYQSDETGRAEIYVEPFPEPGERVQVSADGGSEPVWAGNGEIFYRRGDEVRVVATRAGPPFTFEAPRTLFSFPIAAGTSTGLRTFDVTRDGARLLAITVPPASRPRRIEIVTDWTSELGGLARPAARGSRP
jgi:serine/threonine-protein kinase